MPVIRTHLDLGALVRERRTQLGLDQATLARRIGATRQWIISLEKGHARAELGLALRTLDVLGIRLRADERPPVGPSGVDIDAIVERARRPRRKTEDQ